MNRKYRLLKPNYTDRFECIGSRCEDNCCIGWNVDIDKQSFLKYQKISDEVLLPIVKKQVKPNPYCYDESINYAYVKLDKENRCSFLDDENLCKLQKTYDHSYLSNVCATYPRIFNRVGRNVELSLSASCPEALRLFLFKKESMVFQEEVQSLDLKMLNYDVLPSKPEFEGTTVKDIETLKNALIQIMQDKNNSIEKRFAQCGQLISLYLEAFDRLECIDFEHLNLKGFQLISFENKSQEAYYQKLLKCLKPSETIHNQRYKEILKWVDQGYEHGHITLKEAGQKTKDYFESHEYLLENYFVNLFFRNLFPYTEADHLFDAYLLVYARLILIYYQFRGLMMAEIDLTDDILIQYFQSFSKAIEHHDSFFIDLTHWMRQKKINNLDQIIKMGD